MRFATENGMLNLDDVQNEMNKKRRQAILNGHPYAIWQGKDGRWWTHVPDPKKKNGRRKVVKTHQQDLYDYLYSFYAGSFDFAEEKPPTIYSLYPEWLDYKRLHTDASNSISRLNCDWNTYYVGTEIIDVPIHRLTRLKLDEWAHSLIKEHHMTKTCYYNVTTIIRQILDYAVERELIDVNLMRQVKVSAKLFRKVKKKPSETQVFTQEERRLINEYAWSDYHNEQKDYVLSPLALMFQFETGVRLGELCALRYEDLEDGRVIHVQRMVRRDTKTIVDHTKTDAGDRRIILTPAAQELIRTARDYQKRHGVPSDGFIFSTDERPLSAYAVSSLYTKYSKMLGGAHRSSHKSRKTWISSLIDSGVNINSIREMAGHEDERTTYRNYCFDRSTDDEKARIMAAALSV